MGCPPGGSTRMCSAPKSDRTCPANVPTSVEDRFTMRSPDSGPSTTDSATLHHASVATSMQVRSGSSTKGSSYFGKESVQSVATRRVLAEVPVGNNELSYADLGVGLQQVLHLL